MIFHDILFFIAAIGALVGAIGVVTVRNPFYSVLSLVFHLISLAALFLLLRAEFVAAAQVIVYAGAVMVLYVFGDEPLHGGGSRFKVLGPLFALALAVELSIAVLGTSLKGIRHYGATYKLGFGTPAHIGELFLTKYLFPFEAASLLLLVAAVGAVVLARRRRGLEPDEELERRVTVLRPAFTGTMAEAAGTRVVETLPPPGIERQRAPVGAGSGRPRQSGHEGGW
jgi:NADH-quinone oxidoreductase subunit J